MKVLVTDADDRAALAIARSLGRRDEVHVVGPGAVSLCGVSRYVAAHHRVPSALRDAKGFVEAVAGMASQLGVACVVPVSDAAHDALLPARERIAPVRLAAPEARAFEELGDKGNAVRLARRFGIDVPEGEEVSDAEQALAAAARLGWPVVLKSCRPVVRDASAVGMRPPVVVCHDAAALRAAWAAAPAVARALVQRCVPGRGEGIFLMRWGGCTRAVFGHRRLREKPPGGGSSVLRESMIVDPGLRERLEALLADVGFEGLAMAEFKAEGRNRWLMEFNPRPWGSLQLAIDAGVDFPRLWVDAVCGAPAAEPPAYASGVRSRWLLGDLDHAIALARGLPDPEGHRGWRAALGVLLRPAGPRCHWEVLRRDDPRPFLRELRVWMGALRS